MKKYSIQNHLDAALAEIGEILPHWSQEDGLYLFQHPAYPRVVYGDTTVEGTTAGYKMALKEFIEERLAGKLSSEAEAATSGHGGRRPGAGRPKGSNRKEPTTTVRVPQEVAAWLKNTPDSIEQIKQLMAAP